MKNVLLYTLLLFSTLSLSAQYSANTNQTEDNSFVRKGRFMVETGYNLVGGFGTGTGLSILTDGNDTLTSLGFDGGYFLTDNFALSFKLGLISGEGLSLTNIGIGGKYYIARRVPVALDLTTLNNSEDSSFLGNLSIGYAIPLADNINLEPNLGILAGPGDPVLQFGARFAMFL